MIWKLENVHTAVARWFNVTTWVLGNVKIADLLLRENEMKDSNKMMSLYFANILIYFGIGLLLKLPWFPFALAFTVLEIQIMALATVWDDSDGGKK